MSVITVKKDLDEGMCDARAVAERVVPVYGRETSLQLLVLSRADCRFGEEGCAMLAVARRQDERLRAGYPARAWRTQAGSARSWR